ncbi:MAG TPA: hypothetical protein VFH47_00855 [Candidatus Thermoplasmatota archaeon]|nr:hypothetical protein [Candidatus Thermoplasmatota archaeon]
MGVRPAAAAAVATIALLVPGCLEPHAVRVHPDTLARLPHWEQEERGGGQRGGTRYEETVYRTEPRRGPPYAGMMQVFAIRSALGMDAGELDAFARQVTEDAAQAHHVAIDRAASRDGQRRTAQGVPTDWHVLEGTVQSRGALFDEDVRVRILTESGTDGRSRTSFVLVAFVQVARTRDCAFLLPCGSTGDLRTWLEVAGDPSGSIGGATHADGLAYRLVTH